MLDFDKTRLVKSKSAPVASTATIREEGQALVVVEEKGRLHVRPSTGVANEIFYGISTFERRAPASLPAVMNVPGTGEEQTRVLKAFVNGSARITINGEALDGTTPEATISSDGLLTVTSGVSESDVINIVYRYTPTAQDLISVVGTLIDVSELDAGADVGVLQEGPIYTSNFNTTAAWTVGATPKLGADGNFTLTGAGTAINGIVIEVPSETTPFIGIELL